MRLADEKLDFMNVNRVHIIKRIRQFLGVQFSFVESHCRPERFADSPNRRINAIMAGVS